MSMLDYLITHMLVLATKDIDVNEYAGLFIFTQYAGLFIFAHLLFVLVLFPNSPLSNKS
jgi:hypothetical protein